MKEDLKYFKEKVASVEEQNLSLMDSNIEILKVRAFLILLAGKWKKKQALWYCVGSNFSE